MKKEVGPPFYVVYTAMLKSRKASFKDVFKSVDAFLFPMIKAQGM